MAFRRSESPFDRVKIDLKGLRADKTYQIINLDDNIVRDFTNSIEIALPQKRSSTIFKYTMK